MGVTGCFENRQTEQDFLARRQAIVAKRRERSAHQRRAPSSQSKSGSASGEREKAFVRGGPVPSLRRRREGLSAAEVQSLLARTKRTPRAGPNKERQTPAKVTPKDSETTSGEED